MKKLFISSILSLAVLLTGCTPPATTPPSNPPSQNPPVTVDAQTYKNSTYHFEFNYPKQFNETTPTYINLEEKIVQLSLPKATFPNTNFGDAGFSVSRATAQSLDECLKLNPPEGGNEFKDTATINGVTFYKSSGVGAGAGNRYDTRAYRTFKAPNCLEINETTHLSD